MHSFILFNVILLIFIQNIKLNYIKSNNNLTITNKIIKAPTQSWPNCHSYVAFTVPTTLTQFYEQISTANKKAKFIINDASKSPKDFIYEIEYTTTTTKEGTTTNYVFGTVLKYSYDLPEIKNTLPDNIQSYSSKLLKKYIKSGEDYKLEVNCLYELKWGNCNEDSRLIGKISSTEVTLNLMYVSECVIAPYTVIDNVKLTEFVTKIEGTTHGELTAREPITKENIKGRYSRAFTGEKISTIIFNGDNYCYINKFEENYIIIIDETGIVNTKADPTPISITNIGDKNQELIYEVKENKGVLCDVTDDTEPNKCTKYQKQLTAELENKKVNIYFDGLKIGTNSPNIGISIPDNIKSSLDPEYSWCFENLKINSSYSIKIISTLIISLLLLFI